MDIKSLERNLAHFQHISDAIGCPLLDVCTVIGFETAGTFSPTICNVAVWEPTGADTVSKECMKSMEYQDAIGLEFRRIVAMGWIQFVAKTLKALSPPGYPLNFLALSRMPPEEQAQLVVRYLSTYRGRLTSLEDLYLAILYPMAIGKSDAFVLFRGPDAKNYRQNKGLDRDKDLDVDRAEVCRVIRQWRVKMQEAMKLLPCWERTPPECPVREEARG